MVWKTENNLILVTLHNIFITSVTNKNVGIAQQMYLLGILFILEIVEKRVISNKRLRSIGDTYVAKGNNDFSILSAYKLEETIS